MRGKADAKSNHNGTLSLMLDFGPLLVFFLSYKGAGWIWGASNPITAMTFGTAAFMAAAGALQQPLIELPEPLERLALSGLISLGAAVLAFIAGLQQACT